ncbi:protein atonal homolog 8 [Protopterus annectens]|uniref:protein atonal homolog 8 n=1 Tax=Protopterus annectens TaxID=7888 RepID=UPI001CFAD063|nr:protein atonal homolog 8 [Protopterus annectens]
MSENRTRLLPIVLPYRALYRIHVSYRLPHSDQQHPTMKNPQVLAHEQWNILYKERGLNGIKKLKRRNKEIPKQGYGLKSFRSGPKVSELVFARFTERNETLHDRLQGRTTVSSGLTCDRTEARRGTAEVTDTRFGVLTPMTAGLPVHNVAQCKDKYLRESHTSMLDTHTTAEQSLQSRIVLCQRPSDSSYSSVSHACYSSNSSDATSSPRKRPGEGSGVSSEIKAIQQTRRLLANARERTRVHTISAAFEALRKQVPCYSYGQKLSKLAILRIACNYILSLARLADLDYSAEHSNMSFSECVEQCTRTLQAEGRSKKRKE